jgi:hypothetical protein
MLSLAAAGNPGPSGDFATKENNMKKFIVAALLSGSVALAGLGLSMGIAQAFDPQPTRLARWHLRTG